MDPKRSGHYANRWQQGASRVRLIQHATPLGRVLLVLTIAAAIAVLVVQDTATYLAIAAVCVAWITVYRAADPLHRKRWGDDTAEDSTGWQDREP